MVLMNLNKNILHD
jgi:hypothetical protein